MKITDFFKRFPRMVARDRKIEAVPSPQMVKVLLKSVQVTREDEYSCGEVDRLLDEYAEKVTRGEDTAALMPLMRHHLELCAACKEEYEALLRMLDTNQRI